ncbi:hypothetical protein GCM10009562_37150 [Nocardioides aquaticus]
MYQSSPPGQPASTGLASCPATSDRSRTINPATYASGSAWTHGPDPPSRRSVARTDASTDRRGSSTRLGRPVDPEVSTTSGAGSSGASSQARRSSVRGEESTRRTVRPRGTLPA